MINRRNGLRLSLVSHIEQSIYDLLTTLKGTRLCRRDYGSLLPDLVDQPRNAITRLKLMNTVATAILQFEPRVKLQQVAVVVKNGWTLVIMGSCSEGPIKLTLPLERAA